MYNTVKVSYLVWSLKEHFAVRVEGPGSILSIAAVILHLRFYDLFLDWK